MHSRATMLPLKDIAFADLSIQSSNIASESVHSTLKKCNSPQRSSMRFDRLSAQTVLKQRKNCSCMCQLFDHL
jgi:hypothetical protein